MCEHCKNYESLIYFKEEYPLEYGEVTVMVVGGFLSYEFQTDFFYKDGHVKINYCPMCGRKLEDGMKWNERD